MQETNGTALSKSITKTSLNALRPLGRDSVNIVNISHIIIKDTSEIRQMFW